MTNIPMIAADPYGMFIPGPPRGLPQYVTDGTLLEGDRGAPVPVPDNVVHFDTPFLTDIAHNADPSPVDTDNNPALSGRAHPGCGQHPSANFAAPARGHVRQRDAGRPLRVR